MANDAHENNRQSWNAATERHNSHKPNQAKFLREGGSTLFPEEIGLLGDIRGKTLLHLQCNTGVDTLSLASQLGAIVTGVDISDVAINTARSLSSETGIAASFIRADLLDWLHQNDDQFDVVFASYGAIGWLSDLASWGRGIGKALKPGGSFVIVEFHSAGLMFDEHLKLTYDYMGGRVIENPDGVGDYVGDGGTTTSNTGDSIVKDAGFNNPHKSYEFPWGLADVIMALIRGGLEIRELHEYPYSNGWAPNRLMVESEGRRMRLPDEMPIMPWMFGLRAEKPL